MNYIVTSRDLSRQFRQALGYVPEVFETGSRRSGYEPHVNIERVTVYEVPDLTEEQKQVFRHPSVNVSNQPPILWGYSSPPRWPSK